VGDWGHGTYVGIIIQPTYINPQQKLVVCARKWESQAISIQLNKRYMPDVLLNYLRVLQEGQGLMAPCLPRQICSAQEIHPGPGQMIMEFIIYIYPLH
jgi:hypothetical protein